MLAFLWLETWTFGQYAGTFFNRVIDDGKSSDNTRHLAHDKSGKQYLREDHDICRILLCSGQLYYQLSRARRARKIDNVVLVRLEQIAPFPHDRVLQVIGQYPNAEVCWTQDEPKNQGAWNYVRCAAHTRIGTFADMCIRHVIHNTWMFEGQLRITLPGFHLSLIFYLSDL